MPIGYQIPQAIHGAIEFANEFKKEHQEWFTNSNSIITLSAKNERELWQFSERLEEKNIKHSRFFEPDIGYALTSIAIVPGLGVKKLCSNFPLACKNNTQAQERLNKTFDIIDAMNICHQSDTTNVLEHGISVRDYMFELIGYLRCNNSLSKNWKLPQWIHKYKKELCDSLLDNYTLNKALIFHDLGKPSSFIIDEYGKSHFMDHANKSADIWLTISDDIKIETIIRADMDIHKLSAVGIDEFLLKYKTNAVSLLLIGLSAIHSNNESLDLNNIHFKIKWKHIDRRGNAICNKLFGEK